MQFTFRFGILLTLYASINFTYLLTYLLVAYNVLTGYTRLSVLEHLQAAHQVCRFQTVQQAFSIQLSVPDTRTGAIELHIENCKVRPVDRLSRWPVDTCLLDRWRYRCRRVDLCQGCDRGTRGAAWRDAGREGQGLQSYMRCKTCDFCL